MEAFTRLLVTAGIRVLEAIFALGILGSSAVFVLTAIDHLGDIFKKDMSGKEMD